MQNKPKYPRVPKSLDRRIKYSDEIKAEIKAKYKAGQSMRSIGIETGIPIGTIRSVCIPGVYEGIKAKARAESKEKNKNKIYLEHKKVLNNQSKKYLKKVMPEAYKIYTFEWNKITMAKKKLKAN